MSFMVMAAAVGGAASSLLGGIILKLLGGSGQIRLPVLGALEVWRVTFLLVGAPGLLMALLVLTIREPTRGAAIRPAEFGTSYARFVWRNWRAAVSLKLTIALTFSTSYVVTAWVPTVLIRNFGHSAADAGMALGIIMVPSSILGGFLGGLLGDRMARANRPYGRLRAWLGGTVPIVIGAMMMALGSETAFYAGTLIVLVTSGLLSSLSYPALYDITPVQFRGRAIAVALLLASVIGMGAAITAVAVLTEHAFGNDAAVRGSMSIVTAAAAIISPLLVLFQLKPYETLRLAAQSMPPEASG